jgi:hypothetical protein
MVGMYYLFRSIYAQCQNQRICNFRFYYSLKKDTTAAHICQRSINMKKPLLLIAMGIAAASCVQDMRSAELDAGPVFIPFESISDQCTEAKLSLWFEFFHQFQDEGFDMFEADEKARKQIEAELSACGNQASHTHGEKKSARR